MTTTRHLVDDAGQGHNLWYMMRSLPHSWHLPFPKPRRHGISGGLLRAPDRRWEAPMPPTTHLDSLIAAAKRELDAARVDGDATRIAAAMTMLNGRLDRRLSESGRMRPQPADVRDPEGLCNTYHQAAVGQPPGKGH